MHRTAYPAASSSGTSRPPMYPEAPVTRQRNGDGQGPALRRGGCLGHLAVPVRSPRLAPREARPDTAVRAESARWSSFAVRADGSCRSAAMATPWTSSRASGSAMASSSQVRSRADRKTHMLSVPSSSSRLEAGPWLPGADVQDFCRLSCASVVSPVARQAHSRACLSCLRGLPAARRANRHAGEAGPARCRGMIMASCSSWLPGRMVIRTSAFAATSSGVHSGPNRRVPRRQVGNC